MKKITLLLFTLLCVSSTYAQSSQNSSESRRHEQFLIGKFWDNWFMSAGAGINLYLGLNDYNIGKHVTPAVDFSIGKWISPAFGVRLKYNGISMDASGDQSYWYASDQADNEHIKFSYHAVHANFMVNLTTILYGYNPERKYQLIPFFGLGWSQSQSKVYTNRRRSEFFAIAGLKNNLRISNSFDLHLELSATAVSQRIAGQMMGGKPDFPLAATAGFTYHFGGKNARRWKTCGTSTNVDITLYQNQFNALNASNAQLQAENDVLKEQVAEITTKELSPTQVEKVVEKKVVVPVPVFFELNKWSVSPREVASLRYIAEYIKENPNSKFAIKGYGDSQTGNSSINQNLSDKRAEAIKELLIKKYGINASQLHIASEGGISDLFDPSYLNRAAIVISE